MLIVVRPCTPRSTVPLVSDRIDPTGCWHPVVLRRRRPTLRNRLNGCVGAVTMVMALHVAMPQQTSVAQPQEPPINPLPAGKLALPVDVGMIVPIPADAEFRPHLIGVGEISVSSAADLSGSVVYSNRLGNGIFTPAGPPGPLIADDIATTASAGCVLDRMAFRVSGDPVGDGSGVGPYSVTFALYSACPNAGALPLFGPVTRQFVDNGDYEVIFKPDPATIIEIPTNSYFGLTFSRSLAGIVAGAPATVGFSADRFDFPGTRCNANFGGFPGSNHGSFDLEIFARNDCPSGVCSSTCVGGANNGEFCLRDDCPSGTCTQDIACLGGLNNGDECMSDADCPNMCSGGPNNGIGCDGAGDCPSECRGGSNAGNVCDEDADCPNSTCSIGSCPNATCSGDRCVGGSNNLGLCFIDDCPSGSCSGTRACDGGINADRACVFDCVASFPAYKNSGQGGFRFTSQPSSEFFADDIRLGIPVDENNPCNLVSWEVGFKGGAILNAGAVQAELHTFIDNADPENGGRIPGTRMSDIISGTSVKILKKTFATPIPLTQQHLFVVFKIQNSFVGAIGTCNRARPGSTEDVFFEHDGASWNERDFESGCHAGFEVALNCAGSPPVGACCDMVLTENRICIGGSLDGARCSRDSQCRICDGGSRAGFVCDQDTDCPGGGTCPPDGESFCIGDAVCRDLPEMNCAFPTLWREGESCGAACDGGVRDGESCSSFFDCPPACVGGSNDGGQCFDDSDCAGVCQAGINIGQACSTDAECPSITTGVPTPCVSAGTCGTQGVCRGQFCVGGDNDGLVCSRAIDCPGGECGSNCMGGDNDGLPCVQGSQCPGGFCPATPFPVPCGLGTCCAQVGRCCVTEKECHTAGTLCGLNQEPLETPVQFHVGQPCDQGDCPPCLGRGGDCTQAREGICVGGALDGEPCPFGNPCLEGVNDCCVQGGVCAGQPGCENPNCCAAVCHISISCCTQHWSQTCADIAFETPGCHVDPQPEPCVGAQFLPVNSSVEVDLLNAPGGTAQPGLCCFRREVAGGPGPGSRAEAVVWLKTIAPAGGTCRGASDDGAACTADGECDSGKCRANLSIDTCNTIGGGDDSIIQVFAVGDLDSGLCKDQSLCGVSLQDCFDGSECVLNVRTACGSLAPIGCSDDAEFEGSSCFNTILTDLPFNSKLCVDVVPGDPYFIMVAAKDADALGIYRVTMSEFCQPVPPVLFNDICSDAPLLDTNHFQCDASGDCDVVFDLDGFEGVFAPATFDCPGPPCLNTMENDVWYDWIAPATGRVSAETCAGPNTPDTSLVIYSGCDCPVEIGTELDCSETEVTEDCLLGSRVTAAVQGGECYKLRLGGHFGGTPLGSLKIDFTTCPDGPITGVDPPNETTDARAPLDPNTGTPLGIDSFRIRWPGGFAGTTDRFCYSYCETLVDGFAPNLIFGPIADNGDGTFTVNLARPLAPGAFAALTALHGDGSTSEVAVLSLPGDVDESHSITMGDLDALIDALTGKASSLDGKAGLPAGLVPFDKYRQDMDHSGAFTPRDLLRWLDLAGGLPGAFDPWLSAPFPTCHPCCR